MMLRTIQRIQMGRYQGPFRGIAAPTKQIEIFVNGRSVKVS